MSRSAYSRVYCFICKKLISTAGFAQYNHKMKHVREGKMRRVHMTIEEIILGRPSQFEIVRAAEKGEVSAPQPSEPDCSLCNGTFLVEQQVPNFDDDGNEVGVRYEQWPCPHCPQPRKPVIANAGTVAELLPESERCGYCKNCGDGDLAILTNPHAKEGGGYTCAPHPPYRCGAWCNYFDDDKIRERKATEPEVPHV